MEATMKRIVLTLALTLFPFVAGAAPVAQARVPTPWARVSPIRNTMPPCVRVRVQRPRHERQAPLAAHAAARSRQVVPPTSIHVHDGDTFYVGAETIRLRGIDTPELGQPLASAATRRLIALLHSGPVTIVPRAEDVYGRTVANVYVGGRDVAQVLRAEGYAKPRIQRPWAAMRA
jgi:endonuclease YncB( thermonuclease family)